MSQHLPITITDMTTAQINSKFLASTTPEMKRTILNNIANHYGISIYEAYEELVCEQAESIMDYITGTNRSAISLIFKKFCFQNGL